MNIHSSSHNARSLQSSWEEVSLCLTRRSRNSDRLPNKRDLTQAFLCVARWGFCSPYFSVYIFILLQLISVYSFIDANPLDPFSHLSWEWNSDGWFVKYFECVVVQGFLILMKVDTDPQIWPYQGTPKNVKD